MSTPVITHLYTRASPEPPARGLWYFKHSPSSTANAGPSAQSRHPPVAGQKYTPSRSNWAFTSSRTPRQNPSGTLFRPSLDTYHSLYNINKPLPTPHALRVEPGVLVISPITPTIPVSPSKVSVPDTVLRALHSLTHLTLTTTQGTIMYHFSPGNRILFHLHTDGIGAEGEINHLHS